MTAEPVETIEVLWARAVPVTACVKVSESEFLDAYRNERWIWWRHRWCAFSTSLGDLDFNDLDRRIRSGSLGLLWREQE